MAGLCKGKRDDHAQHRLLHHQRDIVTSSRIAYEVHDNDLAKVESNLPVFDGKYDSAAYVNWELAVDKQFDEYDFSNAQMIKAASNKCTGSASFWWYTVGNKLETWDECKTMMRKNIVFSYYKRTLLEKLEHIKQGDKTVREYFHDFKICITYSGLKENENTMTRFFRGLNSDIQAGLINVTYNHISHLFMLACSVESNILKSPREKRAMLVPPISDILQGAQNIHHEEKSNMIEMPSTSLTKEEEKIDAPTSFEERITSNLNGAAINQVEQPLVEPIAEMPLSQVDLLVVPCDKEELCHNVSLISMPQLVNEHVSSTISLCADSKHVVHIANEVEERELLSSLNTLGYVQFDDFCELDNLKEKLLAKSDLPCPTNAIFHIFGEYNDRGIFLVHRVYICSDLEHLVVLDKICKLERHVNANHIISSLSCFDCKKQVVFSGPSEEHHMEKPRTVFHEEGEDDVTMATMDTTIAHIMNQQEDIKIKSSMCCNLIRPRATLLTSNGRQIYIRAPFWAREYLMESSRSPPSNGSSLISEFYLVWPQSQKQGIRLICTGKINNPRRGVSIAKLLTKVIANRLSKVAQKTISESQTAFIPGRQILDGVVILHEVLHEVKIKKQSGIIVKFGFEKAYDKVQWQFLFDVLERKGFDEKVIGWIKHATLNGKVAININGNTEEFFRTYKGVRQGDPLSPLLFNYVANALSEMLTRAKEADHIRGLVPHLVEGGLTYLQYADDTTLFMSLSDENICTAKFLLFCFEEMSGLKINYQKSEMNSIRSRFFWEGLEMKRKYHMVRWEALCRPKDFGGLGFSNTRVMNIALLSKWIIKLESGCNDACCKLLRNKYMQEGGFFQSNARGASQFWKGLYEIKKWLSLGSAYELGNAKFLWCCVRDALLWKEIPTSRVELLDITKSVSNRRAILCLFAACFWAIWLVRNDWVLNDKLLKDVTQLPHKWRSLAQQKLMGSWIRFRYYCVPAFTRWGSKGMRQAPGQG
uniref:Retroelement n=1 Tax=Oryza sativa subsp. japonica TaxID=39947 RepID=Q8S802_ORYSJ|nr:Putative retroelement [Oryza sativa Japonica Group]